MFVSCHLSGSDFLVPDRCPFSGLPFHGWLVCAWDPQSDSCGGSSFGGFFAHEIASAPDQNRWRTKGFLEKERIALRQLESGFRFVAGAVHLADEAAVTTGTPSGKAAMTLSTLRLDPVVDGEVTESAEGSTDFPSAKRDQVKSEKDRADRTAQGKAHQPFLMGCERPVTTR